MRLVHCKVCKDKVAEDAPTCPHCGTPSPAISQEEERLKREIEQQKEAVAYYEGILSGYRGFRGVLFRLLDRLPILGGIQADSMKRAGIARGAVRRLQKQLDAEAKKKYVS